MAKKVNKGQKLEELIRLYFLKSGYYVIRGIPFSYKNFMVTDIDLWLYSRTSSVSREIGIVDIKNKRTPQAIERIFWVKGLQKAIKATNALVATTDKRPAVKEFGKEMDVFVLDGNFLNKIEKLQPELDTRISDEDLYELIDTYSFSKLDGDWKGKLLTSKSMLANGLDFDNVNKLLELSHFFIEQVLIKTAYKEVALRCFYLICSFIAINIDYIQRELSFLEDSSTKLKALSNGFKYGLRGEEEIKKIIEMSLAFIEQYTDNGRANSNQARQNINKQFENIPTGKLAEYFIKSDVSKSLFQTGIEFEKLAMNKDFKTHINESVEIKSFISVLLDYWTIDRVNFTNAINA